MILNKEYIYMVGDMCTGTKPGLCTYLSDKKMIIHCINKCATLTVTGKLAQYKI